MRPDGRCMAACRGCWDNSTRPDSSHRARHRCSTAVLSLSLHHPLPSSWHPLGAPQCPSLGGGLMRRPHRPPAPHHSYTLTWFASSNSRDLRRHGLHKHNHHLPSGARVAPLPWGRPTNPSVAEHGHSSSIGNLNVAGTLAPEPPGVASDGNRRMPVHQRLGPWVPAGNRRRNSALDADG